MSCKLMVAFCPVWLPCISWGLAWLRLWLAWVWVFLPSLLVLFIILNYWHGLSGCLWMSFLHVSWLLLFRSRRQRDVGWIHLWTQRRAQLCPRLRLWRNLRPLPAWFRREQWRGRKHQQHLLLLLLVQRFRFGRPQHPLRLKLNLQRVLFYFFALKPASMKLLACCSVTDFICFTTADIWPES